MTHPRMMPDAFPAESGQAVPNPFLRRSGERTQAETVAVAVSGGADSLYSLIRLQEQGYSPIALHGIFLSPSSLLDSRGAEAAAMRERLGKLCDRLGVPLHIVDLSESFFREVISPFVQAYACGQTPNPCATCNARIKFGLLLKAAQNLGAKRLATGHYAALTRAEAKTASCPTGYPALWQGADEVKDQSYFLALVPGDALSKAIFPLGDARKTETLAVLERRGLVPPQPGESQEVCFVPGDAYRDFVMRTAPQLGIRLPGPGPMLLTDGTKVGTHKGLWQYTEGQRRGLGVGWKEPLHVLEKDMRGNILRLGARAEMRVGGCECGRINLLLPPERWGGGLWVKTRYREQPKAATVELFQNARSEQRLRVRFLDQETAVAPGQIVAIYLSARKGATAYKKNEALRLVAGGVILASES